MATTVRRWVQSHRYRSMVRQLRAMSPTELRALGIASSQIEYLAAKAAAIS